MQQKYNRLIAGILVIILGLATIPHFVFATEVEEPLSAEINILQELDESAVHNEDVVDIGEPEGDKTDASDATEITMNEEVGINKDVVDIKEPEDDKTDASGATEIIMNEDVVDIKEPKDDKTDASNATEITMNEEVEILEQELPQQKIQTSLNSITPFNADYGIATNTGTSLWYLNSASVTTSFADLRIRGERHSRDFLGSSRNDNYYYDEERDGLGGVTIHIKNKTELMFNTDFKNVNVRIRLYQGAAGSRIGFTNFTASRDGAAQDTFLAAYAPIEIEVYGNCQISGYGEAFHLRGRENANDHYLMWSYNDAKFTHITPYNASGIRLDSTTLYVGGRLNVVTQPTSDYDQKTYPGGLYLWEDVGSGADAVTRANARISGLQTQTQPTINEIDSSVDTLTAKMPDSGPYEIRFENGGQVGEWVEGTTLSNLRPNTQYNIEVRRARTATYLPSKIRSTTAQTISPQYKVTIPATLKVGSDAKIEVASDPNFDVGAKGKVDVKITSGVGSDGNVTLKRNDANNTIKSAIRVNGSSFTNMNTPVATFMNSQKGAVPISFATPTEPNVPAGTYTGTVNFEISYSQ